MNEPLFFFPQKPDREQYEFMMNKSHDARDCVKAFKSGNLLEHAKYLIELVKTGYTRDELDSFLKTLYDQNKEEIRLIEETMSNLYEDERNSCNDEDEDSI